MSVICQNFVQNAWKKDLCSNCFKSVGDHEVNGDTSNQVVHQKENSNTRHAAHATNIYSSSTNGSTPHTTWKSLISERNQKNSQPFKLENGFQGRLLTINKATHPGEKKPANESSSNGHSCTSPNHSESPMKMTFAQTKIATANSPTGFSHQTNGESCNGKQNGNVNQNEKIHFNGVKNMLNEIESKHGKTQNPAQRETSEESFPKMQSNRKNGALKLVKSNSEEGSSGPLHSILKKTVSTPVTSNTQSRRGSNVGFKDEEPLVIGYGGRDFSPEELAWEMNCSDGENETGTDSLDETEDDKAFSKITKQNTEFNSDNANLLIQQSKNREATSNSNKAEIDNLSTSISSENKDDDSGSETESGKIKTNLSSLGGIATNKENTTFSKCPENEIITNGKSNKDNEPHPDVKVEVKEMDEMNEKEESTKDKESINVAIKSCERDHSVTSKERVVVDAAQKFSSREGDKNNLEYGKETPPPPLALSVSERSEEGDSAADTSESSEMFAESDDTSKGCEETEPEGNGEWQEDNNEIAGQILQAINTSLTNRHKINADEMEQKENCSDSASEKNVSPKASDETPETQDLSSKSSIGETVVVTVSDVREKNKIEEKSVESATSFEARPSFLHGQVSHCKAIYGPASDLFVSRSNSSSSSSSDECGKTDVPHSISVTINGANAHKRVVRCASEELLNVAPQPKHTSTDYETDSSVSSKFKPRIPAKPSKRLPIDRSSVQVEPGHYSAPSADVKSLKSGRRKSDSSISQSETYYSVSNPSNMDGPNSITLVDHYAESNIYHEVGLGSENIENHVTGDNEKSMPKRESKLAALAMELEQVRHPNSTKRQAPAPPKIPDPPMEDPPSSTGRISPSDSPHGFSSFRGEAMAFSSSSSTASTSSQDTETGYASWNLHSDFEEKRKHSKSKSSFLLAQYSKCKMLAMGYADDSSKSKKKFSIKKLLKIRKDGTDSNAAFDPCCPNPKAWKYSENYDRPRPKLEIIHPMDLEKKSVTVNPGFDSLHSGSFSSFTASVDDHSMRNSVSSDYGSFYSDAMSPTQDLKPESNYECIQSSRLPDSEDQEECEEKVVKVNSNSPTPSRSSNASQASTLTSESSKNSSSATNRPPKPPPPPRAHSLLPRNKPQNPDGTFKFPVADLKTMNGEDAQSSKPQAPKRQCKPAAPRPDIGIYDNTTPIPTLEEQQPARENLVEECDENAEDTNETLTDFNTKSQVPQEHELESTSENTSTANEAIPSETQISVLSLKPEIQTFNVTVKSTPPDMEKTVNNAVTRKKYPPITKAPSRPPPIYVKPQLSVVAKNPNPWKTLEDSYVYLTASNRELLVKLINQASKKRKIFLAKLQKIEFRWSHFEIDLAQPSSIFAFGEKIAYHATIPQYPEYLITLVVTVQQAHNRLNESNELKYPVFGQFVDCIPPELLDSSGDAELESMQATILVLDRSNISTIECFTENLPDNLTEEHEKELSYIILQLIHSLKSLQAQGIESIDSSFRNLILAKTKTDKYYTLIFLSDNCYDENDYMPESSRISLCQYALMLLMQLLGIQSLDEYVSMSETKFSSDVSRKTFETAIALLSEEKAVSLSQTKILMECFLWELTRVVEILEDADDTDSVLQRWMDVKRSNFIKNIINDESLCDINVQSEYYSQFLIRTSIRNVKEILSYL